MALAHGRGEVAKRSPITVLLSNGSVPEPLEDGDWPPRCHVAALPRPMCQSHYIAIFH